jgi:hypothetical protein
VVSFICHSVVFCLLVVLVAYQIQNMKSNVKSPLLVQSCNDFIITGTGDNDAWQNTKWITLQKLDKGGENYLSRFKILYSLKGIYILFNGEDLRISSALENNFDELFKGDVFEVFFHPNPMEPLYFEYEINALGKELVLLMVKKDSSLTGWKPWPYDMESRILKKVTINGGKTKAWASIKSWTAELFIPYALLGTFQNSPPKKGTLWKANFCRLDYDTGRMIKWAWAPIETSFHETERYFPLIFT